MGFDSGLTSVTGNVTAVQSIKTLTSVVGARDGAGTTTLGTVGAGKKWTLLNGSMTASLGATLCVATLNCNAISHLIIKANLASGGAPSVNQKWDYEKATILTAGQTVTLVLTDVGYGSASIQYVEESA